MRFIEKRLKVKKLKDLINGKFDANSEEFSKLKSVAIFSLQNPPSETKINGQETFEFFADFFETHEREAKSVDYKEIANIEFDNPEKFKEEVKEKWNEYAIQYGKKFLKNKGYRFRTVVGLYDGREESFVVFDIDRGEVDKLCFKFFQESYLYMNLVEDTDEFGSGMKLYTAKKTKSNGTVGNARTLSRHGSNNEARQSFPRMEYWVRKSGVYNYPSTDEDYQDNPYLFKGKTWGIERDTTYTKESDYDEGSYSTRVDNSLAFSGKAEFFGNERNKLGDDIYNMTTKQLPERQRIYRQIIRESANQSIADEYNEELKNCRTADDVISLVKDFYDNPSIYGEIKTKRGNNTINSFFRTKNREKVEYICDSDTDTRCCQVENLYKYIYFRVF